MSVAPGARSLRFAVPERHRYRELQALEDAVNFRLARLMAPCPRCDAIRFRVTPAVTSTPATWP